MLRAARRCVASRRRPPSHAVTPHHGRLTGRAQQPRVSRQTLRSLQATDDPKNTRGGNNTAVSLGNNAALPLLMAGLQQSTITWLQCLQNSGEFLPHPVCKTKRPIPIARMGRSERKRFWGYDFGLEEAEEELEAAPEGVDILPLTRDIGTLSTTTASTTKAYLCGVPEKKMWLSLSAMSAPGMSLLHDTQHVSCGAMCVHACTEASAALLPRAQGLFWVNQTATGLP